MVLSFANPAEINEFGLTGGLGLVQNSVGEG